APTLTLGPVQLTETEFTFKASATDPDANDTRTFSLVSVPAGATIDADGTFHWTPGAGQLGGYDVTVRVTDGGGLYDQKTVHLTTLGLVNTDLVVVGTGGGDTIAFSAAGSAVQVNFNGASVCTITGAQRLLVYGLGGGDDVSVSDGLALPAWLFGGAGD